MKCRLKSSGEFLKGSVQTAIQIRVIAESGKGTVVKRGVRCRSLAELRKDWEVLDSHAIFLTMGSPILPNLLDCPMAIKK